MKRASDRASKAEKVSGQMSRRTKSLRCGVCGHKGSRIAPGVVRCQPCRAAREVAETDGDNLGHRRTAPLPRLEDYDKERT